MVSILNEIIKKNVGDWELATKPLFIRKCGDGSLEECSFRKWFIQDYAFVRECFHWEARLLGRKELPRYVQNILVISLKNLEEEISWFEERAKKESININEITINPICQKYINFLIELESYEWSICFSAIWALEKIYLESWKNVLPGNIKFKSYIEHWTNDSFEMFVNNVEDIMIKVLKEQENLDINILEKTIINIIVLEKDFWNMTLI